MKVIPNNNYWLCHLFLSPLCCIQWRYKCTILLLTFVWFAVQVEECENWAQMHTQVFVSFPARNNYFNVFLCFFGHMIFEVWEFHHKILSFFFSCPLWSGFSSIFKLNCCGGMVVCESNKHRQSILLVKGWISWSTTLKNNKELEVCDCSCLPVCFWFRYIPQVRYRRQLMNMIG